MTRGGAISVSARGAAESPAAAAAADYSATVVITTRNRQQDLRKAIASAVRQSLPVEIVVIDDGSTDGTAEMVAREFPGVKLHRFEESKGLIVRRNQGARLAAGAVIFSIDDDAAFSTPRVVEQTLRDFDDERVGAVAIPYIEPHKDNRVMQRAPDRERSWIADRFIGTAHAVRRDLFLRLDGYREVLFHQGEESDFCIRMLDAGYVVRLGAADVIEHYESPRRDFARMDYYGARNAILFVWQNVPWPAFPIHLAATTFNVLRWTLKPARFARRARAVLAGFAWIVAHWSARRPVGRGSYALARTLQAAGPAPLDELSLNRGRE